MADDVRSTGGVTSESSSVRTYIVQKGDSLSKIAKAEYGDANAWHRIFEANRDTVKDPDRIRPGQALVLPE